MNNNYQWEDDTWVDVKAENGNDLDANLWTCNKTGKQYISFYKTYKDSKGQLITNTNKTYAKYEVIKQK
tara:strand:- start:664 stop:870 length:207 start_codon:yes stop_codon:yes gene_type:complete